MSRISKSHLSMTIGAALALSTGGAHAVVTQVNKPAAGYTLAAADTANSGSRDSDSSAAPNGDSRTGTQMHEGMCGARAFKMMDADGDGKLTEEEFKAGQMKMRSRWHDEHCADGKCTDGHCGGKWREGACGEGSCGGNW